MGASSSGLLDEAKVSHIKGLVDSTFQSFSVFYHQQYSSAYFRHLHQEVEPKKEGRGLLLTQRPQYPPEEVLYQGSVKFSCWDEQGKKCKERYAVLRRDYKVDIHENMETFNRGCAAKLILQPVGGTVLTTEEESRAHLEKMCAGILNGVKEDSSSVVSSPDVFAVYLHLPYTGHTCFLFQQEEERDHFLSALKTCIRHCNLDPWRESSYENQAYIRALRLYRQDKGCYESWEMLLGTEEHVLASQVMEEVLPWLQSQLQSRVKGKKAERIRQWLATVQATHTLVLELLRESLVALREKCRQTASDNQALIRSNLDQIMSSHSFLEQKIRGCVCEEADKVYSESVAPYMSSILEVLTEHISAGIQGMQKELHTQMDSAFTNTNGGTEETKKALSTLHAINLDQCYKQVKNLTETLENLKQRFGLSSTQRLVHTAQMEMEQLLDSAVYTLELFLQSSAKLQPSQVPVKMERAKERVLKQLDYDSRVVQRRLYQKDLLEITLPTLTRKMDNKWKTELEQFEQFIFSDYSSFILVHNVYDDVLRNLLSKEIETVVQDAASKKSNNLLLDISDLAISQYSLLGQTPPRSAPDSPSAIHSPDPSSTVSSKDKEPAPVVEEGAQTVTAQPQTDPELNDEAKPDPSTTQSSEQSTDLQSPLIIVTQQFDESVTEEEGAAGLKEICEEEKLGTDTTSTMDSTSAESSTSAAPDHDAAVTPEAPPISESTNPIPDPSEPSVAVTFEAGTPDRPSVPESTNPVPESPEPSVAVTLEAGTPDPPSVPESTNPVPESPEPSVAVTHETGTPDPPSVPESTNPVPESPEPSVAQESLSLSESTDVPDAECAQSDQSAMPENSATSDQISEDACSVQPSCPSPSHPSCTDSPMKISLGALNEAIGCSSVAPAVMAQQTTDRAVYLTGEIKDNWELERLKEEKQKETEAEEKTESRVDDEEKGSELKKREEDEEEAQEDGDHAEKEEKEEKMEEEEVHVQSPQPMESQPESSAEPLLGSVAIIRELVTEITEVETIISPYTNSSNAP
ncbi:protein Niban 1-like isoform X2 [Toxotes jaculatrix]|uniref:protein Niban 1-like isoform X2 n=1 Tax=Toxotes jaculatrix TaxID=941984 RepID=UPI001B3AFEAE|nr:protein Niban 1-like isoform X2 [Toxotes jaculatrix]